jgi:hypothetical protein
VFKGVLKNNLYHKFEVCQTYGMEINVTMVKYRIKTMLPLLNERQRRIFLAAEARALGYGGISKISEISGVSRVTITQGVKEIESESIVSEDTMRCRKEGGGRKPITRSQSGIVAALSDGRIHKRGSDDAADVDKQKRKKSCGRIGRERL